MKNLLFSFLTMSCFFIQVSYPQFIPENRFKFITNIGLEFERPFYYDHIVDVCASPYFLTPDPNGDPQANYTKLTQIIQDLRGESGWKCIYFSLSGTYRIGNTVNLGPQDNNLVFKGTGSDHVLLHFKIGNHDAHQFNMQGYTVGDPIALNETLNKGTKVITTGSSGSLQVGDWIDVYNDWTAVANKEWMRLGQISKVEAIQGNSVTLRDEFAITYLNTDNNKIQKFIPVQNIGFEDLTFRRDGDDGITSDFGNSNNFNFSYAVNCWIYGVDSWGTRGWHVCLSRSSNLFIHGNWFHHGNDYGNGRSYGITFSRHSSNCLIENNIFSSLRRAMCTQSAANRNIFGYNYSRDRCWDFLTGPTADLSLHGSYSYYNLFEGNIVEYVNADYNSDHGDNGPYNTFFRNYVTYEDMIWPDGIDLSHISYTNIIGNQVKDVENSTEDLDIYGRLAEGMNVTHYTYRANPEHYGPLVYCSDYSYYLTQRPSWISNIYTWPPIGPRISLSSSYPYHSIPAITRYLSGGKKTLDGSPVKTIVKLNPGSYPETNSYGGYYKINGNTTSTWYPLYNEQITIEAFPQNNGDSFIGWTDGNTENPRTITATSRFETFAIFKKVHISNMTDAYANSSQRKFVRTDDGWLHNVYESMGHVWYETSSNNGVTWKLENNGRPLDNSEGKLPSIDYSKKVIIRPGGITWNFYQTFIVFQEKSGSGYKIKLNYFHHYECVGCNPGDDPPPPPRAEADLGTGDDYSINATPVIGALRSSSGYSYVYFIVVWKNADGLYARYGNLNMDNVNEPFLFLNPGNYLTTSPYSVNPTLSSMLDIYNSKLAWEENNSIKYASLSGSQISGPILTPSDGCGYTEYHSPSIIVLETDGIARLCWVGMRWVCPPPLPGHEEDCIGYYQYKVLFKGLNNLTRHWEFGNNVSGPNINKKNSNTTNPYYAFGWYETQGQNKFADNSLSTVRTLNTVGQRVQISNGTDKNSMYGMSFDHNSGLPYYFLMSDNLGSFYSMEKIQYNAFTTGREGVVSVDSADFYFAMGDIEINGQPVDFIEIADTIPVNNLSVLNQYLVTTPINVTDNCSFLYSVQYGINDSSDAVQAMIENRYVNFKVQLVDANTGEIIGEYDDVTYNAENIYDYGNISYQVNTQGIGNRTVRLKLVVDDNYSSGYSLGEIYADESVLGKASVKQINFIGNKPVTSYALSQNYPNPFNPNTTIKFEIPKDGLVTLKVYDILGAEVATLVNEEKSVGRYEANFNASSLASGVYIYRLQVNDYVNVKKMILMK